MSRPGGIRAVAGLAVVAALGLTGCASAPTETAAAVGVTAAGETEDVLAAHGLAGLTGRQIVDRLDALDPAERPDDLIVSVLPDQVLVQPGTDAETAVPLGADEFYLSIAPFVAETHPCTFHSLTTCLGEQRSAPVELLVRDTETGEIYAEESARTFANGFIGVWLPRNRTVEVTATIGSRTGRVVTGTGAQDPTCMTELQLA